MAVVTVAVLALIVWGAGHYYHVQLIEVQNTRIGHIEKNIELVDKKIEEIKQLEKEKERLCRACERLSNYKVIVR